MKKKSLLLSLSILFSSILFSCNKSSTYACYQCYYGKEIPLSLSLPYDDIKDKELQNDILNLNLESPLYFNDYLIENDEDTNAFLKTDGLSYTKDDISLLDFKTNSDVKLIFFVQIPKGYKVGRKENIQEKENDTEIFITPNFYFYQNRTTISYFTINLEKDDTVTSNTIYSTVLLIRSTFVDTLKNTNIRGILLEEATNESKKQ